MYFKKQIHAIFSNVTCNVTRNKMFLSLNLNVSGQKYKFSPIVLILKKKYIYNGFDYRKEISFTVPVD